MNKSLDNISVTIGITCFNAEKTIKRAILSALSQDWDNKEIIIVDDGSKDKSQEIIEKIIFNKKIIFLLNKSNKGTSFSRNRIIEVAKGNLICFMDDDDYSDSQRVTLQVKEFLSNGFPKNKYMACCTGLRKEYSNGYSREYLPIGTNGSLPSGKELANFLLFFEQKNRVDYGFGLPTCSLMISKFCFKKFGKFDLNLKRVEDMDLTIRLSLGNVKFLSVKKIMVTQTANKFTNLSSIENFKSEIILINKYKDYLTEKGLFKHSILWCELRLNYFQKNYRKCFLVLIKLFLSNPKRTIFHFLKTSFKRIIHDFRNGSISFF